MTTDPAPPIAPINASLSTPKKLLLLLANAIPLGQTITLGAIIYFLCMRPWLCVGVAIAWIYLLPPVFCRIVALLLPIRRETIPISSRDFFAWWISLNLQVLFSRFPALEEALRLVPGLYSLWLRLWGSKIGRLTYWAAGTQIFDRQLLRVGNHVTFGAGVRLVPHVILPDPTRHNVLLLAPIHIGDHVNVGGHSLLAAGTHIAPGESTRAFLILPPLGRLENGHRHKSRVGAVPLPPESA